MGTVRILHTADLHLDSSFSYLDKEKSSIRRKEQRQLLDRIIRTAENEKAQVIFIAGDLFDSSDIYGETIESIANVFSSTSLPIVISPGNHDCIKPDSAYSKVNMPNNVFIFSENKIECVELPSLKLRVWGAAFTDTSSKSLLKEFSCEKKDGWLDVMCIHGEVNENGSIYNGITQEQIAQSKMNYIALGHIHIQSGLMQSGNTFYAWPGCPEGRGFDETGNKCIYLVDVYEENTDLKMLDVSYRKYMDVSVDFAEAENFITEFNDSDRVLMRCTITGCRNVNTNITELKRKYENSYFYLELQDKTTLDKNIWDGANKDSLSGVFISKMKDKYDKAENDEEREKILQATQWGIAAFENREGVN